MYQHPNPICVTCRREMAVKKNGVCVTNGILVWSTDVFQCPDCETEVAGAFGQPFPLESNGQVDLEYR